MMRSIVLSLARTLRYGGAISCRVRPCRDSTTAGQLVKNENLSVDRAISRPSRAGFAPMARVDRDVR